MKNCNHGDNDAIKREPSSLLEMAEREHHRRFDGKDRAFF